MSDHDTTPGAPETEALAEIILSCWADPSPEPNEIVFAKAIITAGWISPTEATTRDAAQRAAGAETALLEYANSLPDWRDFSKREIRAWLRERADRIGGAS